MKNEKCMVCKNKAKWFIGHPPVPLCGTHNNQLRRGIRMGAITRPLTYRDIRKLFGFWDMEEPTP